MLKACGYEGWRCHGPPSAQKLYIPAAAQMQAMPDRWQGQRAAYSLISFPVSERTCTVLAGYCLMLPNTKWQLQLSGMVTFALPRCWAPQTTPDLPAKTSIKVTRAHSGPQKDSQCADHC